MSLLKDRNATKPVIPEEEGLSNMLLGGLGFGSAAKEITKRAPQLMEWFGKLGGTTAPEYKSLCFIC